MGNWKLEHLFEFYLLHRETIEWTLICELCFKLQKCVFVASSCIFSSKKMLRKILKLQVSYKNVSSIEFKIS